MMIAETWPAQPSAPTARSAQPDASDPKHVYLSPKRIEAPIKVDGPLAQDDVTSVFNSQGDLTSVTNALGHTISYSNYNGLGLPGRIVNANGGVRE